MFGFFNKKIKPVQRLEEKIERFEKSILNKRLSKEMLLSTAVAGGTLLITGNPAPAVALATSFYAGFVMGRRNKQKNLLKQIPELRRELLRQKLLEIKSSDKILKTNFVFNPESRLSTENHLAIAPISISDEIYKELLAAFNNPLPLSKRPTLPLIDISDAELTDEQLAGLLSVGISKFKTVQLRLKNNELTDRSIEELWECIKESKTSFNELKKLDLSENDLTGESLDNIIKIVNLLNIEELDLSENMRLGEDRDALTEFINSIKKKMPNLKKLSLRNVGLLPEHVETLGKHLSGLSMLESLDISDNEAIDIPIMVKAIGKNLKRNISLRTLKSDHDAVLPKLGKILHDHEHARRELNVNEQCTDSAIVQILNSMMRNQALPESTQKILKKSDKTATRLNKALTSIQEARKNVLNMDGDQKIPVTDFEFVAYSKTRLQALYDYIKTQQGQDSQDLASRIAGTSIRARI
ncbi:MAG: hypothetical protein U1E78_12985 [Gammaproteobacteria bacterium]